MCTSLPVDGMVEVGPHRPGVHAGDEQQIDAHAEVCQREVTHEELGDGHAEFGTEQN